MQDIYDIKSVTGMPIIEWSDIIQLLIIVVLLSLIYFLYKKYFQKKINRSIVQDSLIQEPLVDKMYFINKIDNLIRNIDNYDKKDFVDKLNDILRGFLEIQGIDIAKKLTMSEIKKNVVDESLISLLEEIYYVQFDAALNDCQLDKQSLAMKIRGFIIKSS